MRSAHVYIFWQETAPLYVGCTIDLARRMKEHHLYSHCAKVATHISVLAFDDVNEALKIEAHYIRKLRPAHNVQDNPARHGSLDDALGALEFDAEWFAEQPRWLRDLVNDRLGIDPDSARERKRLALRDLREGRAVA